MFEQPQLDVRDVFRNTAEAVVAAQKRLDGDLGLNYLATCEAESLRSLFTIPRTSVTLQFGVVETETSRWRLVPWRRSSASEQMHSHQLEFTVDAVTSRESLPLSAEDPGLVSINLSAPFFMVPPAEEKQIAEYLLAGLRAEPPQWQCAIPGLEEPSELPKVKKLIGNDEKGEIKAILKALEDDTSERGMVFFRYESRPSSYLAVRVVGKDANDSLFVVTPGSVPEVVIYSMDGDNQKSIRYKPLHHLIQTIRRWQSGALLPVKTPIADRDQFQNEVTTSANGLEPLLPFAMSVRDGYVKGLEFLSRPENESFMEVNGQQVTPSLYYSLGSVRALLTYSIEISEGTNTEQRFEFGLRRTIDNQILMAGEETSETKLIESHASIRAQRIAGIPRVDVELQTPEFVLSSAARARFLKLAEDSREEIAAAFGAEAPVYQAFLENPDSREGVVALLSYRGSEPKEKFLVIWPGSYQQQSRDFAFTCERKEDRLTKVEVRLTVDKDLANVVLEKDGDIAGKQYRAFHNFFHAVRIWSARMVG